MREPRSPMPGTDAPLQPTVNVGDLLHAVERALWFTLLVDLHLAARRDTELADAAEELGWTVQELRPIWRLSAARASISPQLNPFWRHLRNELGAMREWAQTIRNGVDRMDFPALGTSSTPTWAEAAERSREALVEIWRRLAVAVGARAEALPPPRLFGGHRVENAFDQLQQELVSALSLRGDPHRDPRALLERIGRNDSEALARHLTRRVAGTWRIQDKQTNEALTRAAEQLGLSRQKVKRRYVGSHLWPPMDAFSQPQRVEVGQEGREHLEREDTLVRTVSTRHTPGEPAWPESAVSEANDSRPARLWPNDLPVYRTWKWIVNKVIGRAQDDLCRAYDPSQQDAVTDAHSLDHPSRRETEEDGQLHDRVGDPASDRHHEALVAQERLQREIDRVRQMLDIASPQQREVILAKLDPFLAPHLHERLNLSTQERQLANTDCGSWREVAEAVGVSSKGQAHRQFRRSVDKLDR